MRLCYHEFTIMAERRRFTRIARSLVTYYRRMDETAVDRAAVTLDVSCGGIQVELEESFREGDLLSMELVLDDGKPAIDVIGKVVRVGSPVVGIEFVQAKVADVERLTKFVAEREAGSRK